MSSADSLPTLPKKFVRPALMLLLLEQPAHGYELLERLQPLGFERPDPGGLYRNLRALEDAGFVHSAWQQSTAGPDRRIYELTRAGREELHAQAKALAATNHTVQVFLSRYREFVALSVDSALIPSSAR
ncbi:MAG: PadR family transcriptional regulator [Actinomycetota bacterium]|nr:PadR family transcriptional regulator [Actinomycetota bacterium]